MTQIDSAFGATEENMKKLYLACAAFCLAASAAFAGEAEGFIEAIDAEKYTVTLSDGVDYKLPEELDISLIVEGMRVALAFDEVDGSKLVTDMEAVD